MATLGSFSKRIKILGDRVVENAAQIARRAALAVDQTVVFATPVDTGRARSNWQVRLGQAAGGTLPEPSSAEGGAQRAVSEGQRVIPQFKGDGEIHITNNLDYIQKLNEGSSAQAPEGFVEIAVQAGVSSVTKNKSKILVRTSGNG